MARDIDNILKFRNDVSPFLVHLTRTRRLYRPLRTLTARQALADIIEGLELKAGPNPVSAARFGTRGLSDEDKREYFGAISFTETPLSEIHCLLDVANRQVNLQPYGLVFLKDNMRKKGVSPVIYLNNEDGEADDMVRALCELIDTNPESAKLILPNVSFFGQYIKPVGASRRKNGVLDFMWEREWRYPASKGEIGFDEGDVFIGVCPDNEIDDFEDMFDEVEFIDPTRPITWYAPKLLNARKRLGLKASVV